MHVCATPQKYRDSGDRRTSVGYVGKYVAGTAIGDGRIIADEDCMITFKAFDYPRSLFDISSLVVADYAVSSDRAWPAGSGATVARFATEQRGVYRIAVRGEGSVHGELAHRCRQNSMPVIAKAGAFHRLWRKAAFAKPFRQVLSRLEYAGPISIGPCLQ